MREHVDTVNIELSRLVILERAFELLVKGFRDKQDLGYQENFGLRGNEERERVVRFPVFCDQSVLDEVERLSSQGTVTIYKGRR